MSSPIEMVSRWIQNPNSAALFFDVWLKSFVLLALAGGLCLLWRRASAATRHVIWFLAVASLPFLPLLSSLLPSWHRPLWSVSTGLDQGNQISLALELAPVKEPGTAVGQQAALPKETSSVGQSRSKARPIAAHFNASWLVFAALTWFGGVVVLLIAMLAGRLQLGRISRKTELVQDAGWISLLKEACETLRLRRALTLLKSTENVMPLTWGWWRPVVLLPAEAEQWPVDRRRVVLLHELAHVKRGDCFTQLVAGIVCAFYWFNPLVWLAARRMCIERERACDDLVLNGGCKASDYASHLVEIARSFRPGPQRAAIAMARASGLERRVTAVLDDRRDRNRMAKRAVMFLAVVIIALEIFVGGYAQQSSSEPWSMERSKVADQLKRFVVEKRAQAIAGVKADRLAVCFEARGR